MILEACLNPFTKLKVGSLFGIGKKLVFFQETPNDMTMLTAFICLRIRDYLLVYHVLRIRSEYFCNLFFASTQTVNFNIFQNSKNLVYSGTATAKPAFTCSKPTTVTPEQYEKSVQT